MWEKEKNLSTHEELNLRPSDSVLHSLPLSHRDSVVSEVYYKVHMTCFQHTARISNVNSVKFVNRRIIKETISFEFGKEMEKDVFCLVTSVGQRRKCEFS